MRTLAFALLLSLPQDGTQIDEWIRDLGDDSLEVRESAMDRLIRAGEKAVKRLREARNSGNAEIRARVAQTLAEIDRRKKAREFDRGPSLITLARKDASLESVLRAIAEQAHTALSFKDIPATDPVTVAFDKTPLFEALDALCRSHGKIDFTIEESWGDDPKDLMERMGLGMGSPSFAVKVRGGKYGVVPRVTRRQFEVRLSGITLSTDWTPGGARTHSTSLTFGVGWEKGTRPIGVRASVDEITDDLGNSYAEDFAKEQNRLAGFGLDEFEMGFVDSTPQATMPRIPVENAKRLTRIKGSVEVVLPEEKEGYSFDTPREQLGTTRKGNSGQVKLLSFSRDKKEVTVSLEIRPWNLSDRLSMVLKDKAGKKYSLRSSRGSGDGEKMLQKMTFQVPEQAEELSIQGAARTGRRSIRIPFEFRDIRIR